MFFFFFISLCFVSFAFASLVLCSETGCVCCVAPALARACEVVNLEGTGRRRRRVGKKVQQQLERERASLVLLS